MVEWRVRFQRTPGRELLETFVVERVQTGIRIEKRILKVLKGLAEYLDMTLGDLVEFINEYGTIAGQPVDHEPVVYYFVPHVNGCAKQLQGPFDNFDSTVDTGAKSPRIGQENIHHASFLLRRLTSKTSSSNRITPQVMAESATLNAG